MLGETVAAVVRGDDGAVDVPTAQVDKEALLVVARLGDQEHQLELEHPEIAPESSGPRARPAEPG